MLDKRMEDALNDQVNAEFFAAYLYLAMSAYFESKSLPGVAQWLQIQYREELTHAQRIYLHIVERGGRVKLKALEEPPVEWDSPLAAFEAAYGHETKVTGMINDLISLADELKDHASRSFLMWFVDEQVEEEASADEIVQKMKLVGSDSAGLFMVDQEMSKRVYNPPVDLGVFGGQ